MVRLLVYIHLATIYSPYICHLLSRAVQTIGPRGSSFHITLDYQRQALIKLQAVKDILHSLITGMKAMRGELSSKDIISAEVELSYDFIMKWLSYMAGIWFTRSIVIHIHN